MPICIVSGISGTYTSGVRAINFQSAMLDRHSWWSPSNPDRITVNKTGYYRVNFSAQLGDNTSGVYRILNIMKEGAVTLLSYRGTKDSEGRLSFSIEQYAKLNASEYIYFTISHAASSAVIFTASTASVEYLGP